MNHIFPHQRHGVLAHDDAQSMEGSGSGVAVATGWQAAGHILSSAQMMISPHIPCLHTQREEN